MFSMYEDADREEEWEGPEDQILHPWWSSRLQIFTQERTNHLKLSYIKIDIGWSLKGCVTGTSTQIDTK